MTGETKWTCELCNETMRASNKGNHVRWTCPRQGNMLKAIQRQEREAARAASIAANPELRFHSFLACLCGCGEKVGQLKGARKKHYVNDAHYEAHRALMRRNMGRSAEPEEDDEELEDSTTDRRLAEEMAPVTTREAEVEQAAREVPMVRGEASFRLWARCLGFSVDAAPVAT